MDMMGQYQKNRDFREDACREIDICAYGRV